MDFNDLMVEALRRRNSEKLRADEELKLVQKLCAQHKAKLEVLKLVAEWLPRTFPSTVFARNAYGAQLILRDGGWFVQSDSNVWRLRCYNALTQLDSFPLEQIAATVIRLCEDCGREMPNIPVPIEQV